MSKPSKIACGVTIGLLWLFATWFVGSRFGWFATGGVDIAAILVINAVFPDAFRRQKDPS